jgi:LCP family protein required for cell wall assembly
MNLRGQRPTGPGGPGPGAPGPGGPSPGGPPRPKRRHVLRWVSAAVVVIISGALLTAYVKYKTVYDSIHRVTVHDLGKRPPVYSTSSMNILVYGSDSRAGLDHHEQVLLHTGGDAGNNTDTIMLVHISPGRHLVTVMSIPRDTMVPSYQCDAGPGYPGQQANPNSFERINSLLAVGGPSCLWKTVEQQTGVHIDHFIEIGLAGFVSAINDLNGVNVCAPFNVDDPVSGLELNAGQHHINGVTALAFWRTREDIGLGSDLQRIQRDQFMSAQVVKGVLSSGLLSSPTKLLSVLTDVAPSLTTDSGMSQSDLLHIGLSLHGLAGKDVQFVTAPNQPFPANPTATVEFAQPQAGTMFSAIAHDVSIPKTAKGKAKATADATPVLETSPSQVKVQVLNGSGAARVAAQASAALASRGFDVTGTGNAPTFGYVRSVIEYASSAQLPEADTLAKQLTSVTLKRDPALAPGTIELILGSDYTALAPAAAASASPAAASTVPGTGATATPSPSASNSEVSGLAASSGGINAAASCGSDASAFAGPLSP